MNKTYNPMTGEKIFEEGQDIQKINQELLEALKLTIQALKNIRAAGETAYLPIIKQGEQAIAKTERRGEK